MALVKCKECGNTVSTKAQACPHCGAVRKRKPPFARNRRPSYGCGLFALMLIGFLIIGIVIVFLEDSDDSEIRENKPKTQQEIRKDQIGIHFSAWDGSHRGMTKLIKASMNDPDSYDHVETTYGDKGDHLIVKTVFRGKNSFGGVVKNWILAKVDLDGNVIEVISQGP